MPAPMARRSLFPSEAPPEERQPQVHRPESEPKMHMPGALSSPRPDRGLYVQIPRDATLRSSETTRGLRSPRLGPGEDGIAEGVPPLSLQFESSAVQRSPPALRPQRSAVQDSPPALQIGNSPVAQESPSFSMAALDSRTEVALQRDTYYTCVQRCVLRQSCSMDSPVMGVLDVGEVVLVADWVLNECRTTRIRLLWPTECWTNATLVDGSATLEPLQDCVCVQRTQLRTGYEMDSEKCGVLEAGAVFHCAWRKRNQAGITRCKLVLPDGTVSWCVPLLLPASRHPHPVHTFVVFVRRASETSSKGQVVLRPCDEGQQLDHSTSAVSPSGTVANISLSPSPRSPRTLGRKSFAL